MRAAVLDAVGSPAVVRELELIEPRAGEVRVRMVASGVCRSDLHVRDGDWERPTPIVMGHEGAGIVEAIGPGVTTPRIGQLVALTWLIPCGVCRSCRRGEVWACPDSPSYRHALLDGTRPFRPIDARDHTRDAEAIRSYCAIATMAEATVVPAAAAIAVPDGTDPAAAALIGCCVTTGVGAVLKTAAVPAGRSVAVIGLGGVGLSAVMGAVIAGASRIVALDRVPEKLDLARSLGATDVLLVGPDRPETMAALADLTDGGPDVIVDAIGLPDTAELAIAALPVGGTAVLVGMPASGARVAFESFPFVDGARRILGCNYGSAEPSIDFPRYAQWSIDGRLPIDRLIERRIRLDDLEDAFDAMRVGRYARQVIDVAH